MQNKLGTACDRCVIFRNGRHQSKQPHLPPRPRQIIQRQQGAPPYCRVMVCIQWLLGTDQDDDSANCALPTLQGPLTISSRHMAIRETKQGHRLARRSGSCTNPPLCLPPCLSFLPLSLSTRSLLSRPYTTWCLHAPDRLDAPLGGGLTHGRLILCPPLPSSGYTAIYLQSASGTQVSGSALDKSEYFKIYGEMLKMLDGQDSLPDTYVDFFFERSVFSD